jgi:hypothetical protein
MAYCHADVRMIIFKNCVVEGTKVLVSAVFLGVVRFSRVLNVIIVVISLALFVYWFRYMCIMILRDRGGRNYAGQIASANHLMFLRAKALLADDDGIAEVGKDTQAISAQVLQAQALDRLEQSLDRDYRVVTYLLHNAAEYCRFRPVEQFVLTLDFHLMRICYRMLRGISHRLAKSAVLEMARIVGHLAQSAGERLVTR